MLKKFREINSWVKTLIWRKKCWFFRKNCNCVSWYFSTLRIWNWNSLYEHTKNPKNGMKCEKTNNNFHSTDFTKNATQSAYRSGKSDRPQLRQGSGILSFGIPILAFEELALVFCFPSKWICPIDGSNGFWVSCKVFLTRFLSFKCLDNRLEITCWGLTWMWGKSKVISEGPSNFVVLGLSSFLLVFVNSGDGPVNE